MNTYHVAETKTIQVDDKDYLFLVRDKAIFEMDQSTKSALADLERKDGLTPAEIRSCLPGLPAEDGDDFLYDLLKRRVVIAENETVVRSDDSEIHQVPIPLKTLILHLTDACNLRCQYCYHAEWSAKHAETEMMGEAAARQAVDFLVEHSGNLEEIVLVFFGGEPLLNFKLIPSVVDYARQQASEKGKKISFAMTTNGTLLRDEIVDFLHHNHISVTVSLDGFDEVHDRYRRFPDGSPSYAVVLPKLKRLLNHSQNRPVVARVTLVEKPDRVPQILDHLLTLGFAEVGFAPVTTGHPEYQLGGREMDLLLNEFEDLSKKFLQVARKGEFFGFSNLIDLLVSLHQGEVMNYPCGAGLGLFSVDPLGRLYLCQRFTGIDAFHMGDIFHGFDRNKLMKFREEAEISNKAECRQCWVRTICTGGCYHEACVREGSHLKPNLHYCEWIKRWSEIGLEVYCRLASAHPDYLDKLCMSRGYQP